jgi:hypothetical protein
VLALASSVSRFSSGRPGRSYPMTAVVVIAASASRCRSGLARSATVRSHTDHRVATRSLSVGMSTGAPGMPASGVRVMPASVASSTNLGVMSPWPELPRANRISRPEARLGTGMSRRTGSLSST